MNTNSKDSHDKPGRQADLAARERRVCSVCGAKFSATRNSEFCPVCMLRQALPDAVESVESPFEDTVTLTERFETGAWLPSHWEEESSFLLVRGPVPEAAHTRSVAGT